VLLILTESSDEDEMTGLVEAMLLLAISKAAKKSAFVFILDLLEIRERCRLGSAG
jgi:hypothetical protein